jgi:hypothetical protein
MIQRILTGWTFTRALYVLIGTLVIAQSIVSQQWVGVVFGGYFASMGIFAFGCAGGNCAGVNSDVKQVENNSVALEEVEFTEVKQK